MKEALLKIIDRPAVLIVLAGLAALLLAAAGSLTLAGQSIAIAEPVWRIVLAGTGLPMILTGVALILRDLRNPRPKRPFALAYDLFLASPMAAFEDTAAFQRQRADIARIKEALRAHAKVGSIYDAGEKIGSSGFNPQDVAAEDDLEALRLSRTFLLIYPQKIASSVLFEAGYAIGMGKPAIYVTPATATLPFLMQQLSNLSRGYPQVRIWECADTDALVQRIAKSGARMFCADAT